MTGLYILLGTLIVTILLLLWMRADLRRSATAKDDLAEARKAEGLTQRAERAEAEQRARDEGLR